MSDWPSRGRSAVAGQPSFSSYILAIRRREKGSQFPEDEWGDSPGRDLNWREGWRRCLVAVVRCCRPMEGAAHRCRGSARKSSPRRTGTSVHRNAAHGHLPRRWNVTHDACTARKPRIDDYHRNAAHGCLHRLCRRDPSPPPPPGRRAAFYACW
jgi:hypothetical protein